MASEVRLKDEVAEIKRLTKICKAYDLDPKIWGDWDDIMQLDKLSIAEKQWLYDQYHKDRKIDFL